MVSPYRIKRITVKNLRSLDDAEVDLRDLRGLIRVGGRNGQGKSTAFYIGMYALLGFTQPLPLVTRGKNSCLYEVENEYGMFGFRVDGRKVEYYYKLNDGRGDYSNMSINNNPCLDVIRAYLGFDLDEEFKVVLNINSGKFLNFVTTNGRSDLGFLKQLVYSEELEGLQNFAIEEEKEIKKEIERVSDKIQFMNIEIHKIKTVDEEWIRNSTIWLNDLEQAVKALNDIKCVVNKNLLIHLKLKKLYLRRVNLIKKLSIDSVKSQKLIILKKQLNKNLNAKMKLIPIVENLETVNKLNTCYKKNEILVKLIKLKKNQIDLTRLIVLYKEFKTLDTKNKFLSANIDIKNSMDLTMQLKELSKLNLYGMIIHRKIGKAFLRSFIFNLLKERNFYLESNSERLGRLSKRILYLYNKLEDNKKINTELDRKIYKDGRCILCYSKKSIEKE